MGDGRARDRVQRGGRRARARQLSSSDARYAAEVKRERDAAVAEGDRLRKNVLALEEEAKKQSGEIKTTPAYLQLLDRETTARQERDRALSDARTSLGRARQAETDLRELERRCLARLEQIEALEAQVADLTRRVQTSRVEYVPVHASSGDVAAEPPSNPSEGDVSMRFALLEIER